MTYRTAFMVRPGFEGAEIDSRATWDDVEGMSYDDLEKASDVAARVTGDPRQTHPAVEIAKAVQYWELRRRFNNLEGVYLVITDEPPTDEELLAWWKNNRTATVPGL